jgi:hypothetical protein
MTSGKEVLVGFKFVLFFFCGVRETSKIHHYLLTYLSTYLFICLFIYLFIYIFTYLPTYLLIYLSIYLYIYLFIYLPTPPEGWMKNSHFRKRQLKIDLFI